MSDNKSKAEKLAEGKKKVGVQDEPYPRHIKISILLQLKKFQSKNKGKAPPVDSATDTESHLESDHAVGDTTPVHGDYHQSTMDNFSQLSQRFDNLEQELGRSLSTTKVHTVNSPELLEAQVHELTRKLNEERHRNQGLELRLREQYSNVDELKLKLQHSEVGSVSKVQTELAPLRDQLDNQIQTVALLVGEKAELSALLAAADTLSRSKELENEELHAKLGASRHHVQKLKEELVDLKLNQQRFDTSQQSLCTEVETTRDNLKALRRTNEDLREEVLELRRKFELKEIDFNALEATHKEKLREIEGLHLRLTQLVGGDEDPLQRDRANEASAQQRIALEAQIQELVSQVERANTERDNAAAHYQNYVQQLNKERDSWITKVQEATTERDELAKRDLQLVRHIGELEKQMQQQRSVQAKVSPPTEGPVRVAEEEYRREAEMLAQKTNDLEGKLSEERESGQRLSELLRLRDEGLVALERELERLRNSHVDPHEISATLESEKVAASRAMAQNQQLRAQLEEMQTAFVQMTNDKAHLMTELESERYMGREMRTKYSEWDEEVNALRQKLHFKDEEMIRLTHEGTEQAKNILMLQQEVNQLRSLEVKTRNQSHLQTEIVKQREQINKLQAAIRRKEEEAKQMGQSGDGGEGVPLENGHEQSDQMEVSVAEEVDEGLKTELPLSNGEEEEITPENVEVLELPTGEAMLKLQARFTRTMGEIAELTEEKQRLEHLVIQLQGETETIGEYIELYQNQRKLLRQREIEKDIQVQKITADREEMKEKLLKLNGLVEQMLTQRNIREYGELQPEVAVPELAPGATVTHSAKDSVASRETAEQILDLLTEIKTQNINFLTDPMPTTCSCCSGQLITV